jgi:hypothetical protein
MTHAVIRFALIWTSLLLIASAGGCSSASQPPRVYPGIIAIHNASDKDLQQVMLREARSGPGESVRLGSVSPVPMGTIQQIVRGTNAPPLPLWVKVRWLTAQGRAYAVEVSLADILSRATGAPGETLVFAIRPQGRLELLLKN